MLLKSKVCVVLGAALAVSILFSPGAAQAQSGQGTLNLAPLKPLNPGFGQTVQIRVKASIGSKPVKNATVELWFSGRHGVQSYHWYGTTDRYGFCTTLATIPRNWVYGIYGDPTWVDLNVACNQIGDSEIWRIKDK